MEHKPKFLYHGSPNRNIEVIELRNKSVRSDDEGLVVFGAIDKIGAMKFMMPCGDSWSHLARINGVHIVLVADKERFFREDKGGAVYTLPSDSFDINPRFTSAKTNGLRKKKLNQLPKKNTIRIIEPC